MAAAPVIGLADNHAGSRRGLRSGLTIHVGDSSLWVGDGHTEWSGAIIGEILSGHAAVTFIDSGHVAANRTAVPTVHALAAVLGHALNKSRLARPGQPVTVTCPTHWGPPRRALFGAAAHRLVDTVEVLPVALCPGVARVGRRGYISGRARCLVVECDATSITASYVIYEPHGSSIESCEHHPTLAAEEISTRSAELTALLAAAAANRPVDAVLVVGPADDATLNTATLDAVTEAVPDAVARTGHIRSVTGRDIVKEPPQHRAAGRSVAASADSSLSFPQRTSHRGVLALFGIGAAVLAATTWYGYASAPNPIHETTHTLTVGRVTFVVPAGWKIRPAIEGESAGTVRLVPSDGSRRRIEVTQTTLRGNPDLEQVQDDLQQQRDDLGKQTDDSEITRTMFGGRPVLVYEQSIEADSQASHHVIVDHGAQVSVDCQYMAGEWDAVAGACGDVVASVNVGP